MISAKCTYRLFFFLTHFLIKEEEIKKWCWKICFCQCLLKCQFLKDFSIWIVPFDTHHLYLCLDGSLVSLGLWFNSIESVGIVETLVWVSNIWCLRISRTYPTMLDGSWCNLDQEFWSWSPWCHWKCFVQPKVWPEHTNFTIVMRCCFDAYKPRKMFLVLIIFRFLLLYVFIHNKISGRIQCSRYLAMGEYLANLGNQYNWIITLILSECPIHVSPYLSTIFPMSSVCN